VKLYEANGYEDDPYSEDFDEDVEQKNRPKRFFAILFIALGLVSSTVAANISIGNGRIEMGQGLYQIKACDQWVAIGLYPTAATYPEGSRIDTIELVGLDPRLCKDVIFQLKLFDASTSQLPIFTGTIVSDTNTATIDTGTVRTISVYDTMTVSYTPGVSTPSYNSYASKALTLVNEAGINVGYSDSFHRITYYAAAGTYRIKLLQPLCPMESVTRVTIESAKLKRD
jgi:hypothetical protein